MRNRKRVLRHWPRDSRPDVSFVRAGLWNAKGTIGSEGHGRGRERESQSQDQKQRTGASAPHRLCHPERRNWFAISEAVPESKDPLSASRGIGLAGSSHGAWGIGANSLSRRRSVEGVGVLRLRTPGRFARRRAPLRMTVLKSVVLRLTGQKPPRPDTPGPPDSRGRLSPHG